MTTTDRATALAAARTTLAALDLTPQDLLEEGGRKGITFGDFVTSSVLPALSKGKRQAWSTYQVTALRGLPGLCACFCDACLDVFRGDSQWVACPCIKTGECHCGVGHLTEGPIVAASCLERCTGLGDREFAAITLSELEHLSHWVQLRAEKRTASRNRKRALEGRPQFSFKGHSAVEHLRAFLSFSYKMARGDRSTGITLNIALDMSRFPRPTVQKRSYSAERLEELWQALYTSGSNDVELDVYAVSFFLETGGRRSATWKMRIGDLLASETKVRMGEKANKIDEQPISEKLLEALLCHAIQRGDVVLRAAADFDPEQFTLSDVTSGRITLRPEAPVFYYRRPLRTKGTDGTVKEQPHPLTKRRFDSLWQRLKRELPWLDAIHGRPHDLRKTVGTLIERSHGHATARAFLRHAHDDVTSIYTVAGEDEVERAHQWLTGTGEWH